ncbi:MAG: DUF4919 domain-containing protein [Rikenellaceae bacterium]
MIKRLSIFTLILLPALVLAKIPNEDDILGKITDSKSEYYYDNLRMRFERGDINLSADHYHYLYYGYLYNDDYKPLITNPETAELLQLAAEIDIEAPNKDTLNEIIEVATRSLRYDPFDLKVWNIMAFAYGTLGDKIKEREAYDRVEKLLATIYSSGDGLTPKSPRHILRFEHAKDLMTSQNLITTKPMIISRNVEFIPLLSPKKVDGKKIKGYYFDFSRVYHNKPDSVTYKRSRTWQFNNLKPREYK